MIGCLVEQLWGLCLGATCSHWSPSDLVCFSRGLKPLLSNSSLTRNGGISSLMTPAPKDYLEVSG